MGSPEASRARDRDVGPLRRANRGIEWEGSSTEEQRGCGHRCNCERKGERAGPV